MDRMLLLLRRSPEQDAALLQLVEEQQDPASAHFHQWLTPEQFGEQFGPALEDTGKIAAWLTSQGFRVDGIANGRNVVEFSGTAAQVATALHTEIHGYLVNGERHWANARDPQIPAALSPVVAGIVSLHNFPMQALHRRAGAFRHAPGDGGWAPASFAPRYTIPYSGGVIEGIVGPYDFATIYNVLPLWNAGIDGTGQKIAIAGRSNIVLQDVRNFRSVFGLPAKDPTITVNGSDPGTAVVDDELENVSDVEWAGAVAKGATINLVVSKTTSATNGADLSAQYIVNNDLAPVLSFSYGNCELIMTATHNQFYYNLWQQAATEGITVVVASGDGGSAACDVNDTAALFGLTVTGSASTPYNVAVGGTDFSDLASQNQGQYWSSTNTIGTLESAKSYVPEMAWNDSCTSPELVSFYGQMAGVSNAEAMCNSSFMQQLDLLSVSGGGGGASSLYPKPSWQSGVSGIPTDGQRDLPDVSLFAGDGIWLHSYALCQADNGGPCSESGGVSGLVVQGVGGTSIGAPTFAAIMALINQKTGSPQGLANSRLYSLAAAEYGGSSSANTASQQACNASAPPAPGNTCVFYDVAAGNNDVPCLSGSLNCSVSNVVDKYGLLTISSTSRIPAYNAGAGYDLATGLGSINVANLANQWVPNTPTSTSQLTIGKSHTGNFTQGQTGATHTVTVSNSASAAATSGTVTVTENPPTGLTVISMAGSGWTCTASTCTRGDVLNPGASYPAITVTVNVASNAPSPVTNQATVSGGGSNPATASDPIIVNPGGGSATATTTTLTANPATIPTTASTTLSATVTPSGGSGTPTGTVAFTMGATALGSAALTGTGGTAQAALAVNGSLLSVGSNSITATYGGDANYKGSSSAAVIVTVTQSTSNTSSYTISTVAGSGGTGAAGGGFGGDGEPATSAQLSLPEAVVVDSAGNLYIADTFNVRIRKVTTAGTISTVAGTGTLGFNGDNIPATTAELRLPDGVAVDSFGNVFIADETNNRIRKVTLAGTISTVAGTGTAGFNGDGQATSSELFQPAGIAVDSGGNLFIADNGNNRIRKLTPAGAISTVAGDGTPGYKGDGLLATSAELNQPSGVAVDSNNNLYIADLANNVVRKVTSAGIISTVAGTGSFGSGGDNGPATSAQLFMPWGVAVDGAGNLFIADWGNNRIRKVTSAGTISTVAGNGTVGFTGDGLSAVSAELAAPEAVAVDAVGDVFIADTNNNRIRKLTPASVQQPSLTVSKSHSGAFTQGQTGAAYTITAGNAAASSGPTSGTVTVAENPPTGLTVVSMAGTGWNCSGSTCTRSDALSPGLSYPAIMVTVNVAANAPSQVTNQVTVSGGGSSPATANDPTNIVAHALTPTTASVVANPSTISTTGSAALTATVTAAGVSGGVTPTGTVTFNLGNTLLGSPTLSGTGGTAQAAWTVSGGSPLTMGANVITANYSGDANFAPCSGSVTVTVAGTSGPTITAVENGASFQAGFASATWVSIVGTNLAQTTRTWQNSDFVNGLLPTSLSGVFVTMNGVPAYVEYISPTQINVLAPDDATVGAVQVQVTTLQGTSNSFTTQKQQFAPGLFIFDGIYAVAQHADYSPVAKPGLLAGLTTTAAAPGETVIVWATGFGPTNPLLPTSQLITAPAPPASSVTFTIGGVAAPVAYAGLVGPGLYQFNVTVPDVPNGDAVVVAQVGGVPSQTGVLISVQSPTPTPPAPQIASLSPPAASRGSVVSLTINGSNLSGVTALQFSPSTGIAVSNVNATASQVTATVTIAANAPAGPVSVSVSVTPSAGISNPVSFTIQAPVPQITSLSLVSASQGSTVSLSIAGSNLSTVTGVQFSPSTGISVSSVNATNTQVTATVIFAATAPAGQVSVSVTSPAGTSNALFLTILAPGPQIASLSPASGSPGTSVSLSIAGSNLSSVTGVQFSPSTGITVSNVNSTASQVTATVTISASAPAGQVGVSVTSSAGSSNSLAFTILAPGPQITALSPTSGSQGSSVALSITGSNLSGVTAVQFSPSTGITVSNVNSTASQVTATVTISANAPAGQVNVSVTSSAGSSNSLAFTILAPGPQITALSPASGLQGNSVALSIAGSNLSGVTAVQFSPSTGITVSNVNSTASQVTATVTISANAPAGQVSVSVTSSAGTSNSLAFTIQPQTTCNYNGQWYGTTSQSQPVSMTVASCAVTAYSFGVNFPNLGSNCPAGETVTSGQVTLIPITGSTFSNSTISGTFQSATQVNGTINWTLTLPGCSASGSVTWNAAKQ
jgi:uncharacterized protein (TIGR03437 family)